MNIKTITLNEVQNTSDIFVLKPLRNIEDYRSLIFNHYSKEFFVNSVDDVNIKGDIYELHVISFGRFEIVEDKPVGFISISRYQNFVREAIIDAALYPEFVGQGYMQKFMPAIVSMARACGYAILTATTSMNRRKAMEACGYQFIEESAQDRGYFEYYVK